MAIYDNEEATRVFQENAQKIDQFVDSVDLVFLDMIGYFVWGIFHKQESTKRQKQVAIMGALFAAYYQGTRFEEEVDIPSSFLDFIDSLEFEADGPVGEQQNRLKDLMNWQA